MYVYYISEILGILFDPKRVRAQLETHVAGVRPRQSRGETLDPGLHFTDTAAVGLMFADF